MQAGCRASVARFSRDVHMDRLLAIYGEMVAAGPAPDRTSAVDDDLLAAADAFTKRFGVVER
ncbi:MAG: hypothetical protein R3F34_01695 [Planctomycetota bacterium]